MRRLHVSINKQLINSKWMRSGAGWLNKGNCRPNATNGTKKTVFRCAARTETFDLKRHHKTPTTFRFVISAVERFNPFTPDSGFAGKRHAVALLNPNLFLVSASTRVLAAFVFLFISAGQIFAAESLDDSIKFLLDHVAKSDVIFIRNGQTHTAQEAA